MVLIPRVSRFHSTCIADSTGEEDEDVECELKGVKLYIKRGVHDFSDGMLGHVKLLANKTTLDERLRESTCRIHLNCPTDLIASLSS